MIVLLVFVGYRYGYVAIHAELAGIKETQATKTRTLEKYIALIAEKPDLEKRLASLIEERKANNSKLIEGQTPSLAAATLQETLKGQITSHGGTISSERVGKSEDLGKFRIINVTIDAVVPDSRALSDILFSIETRTPYLVVKELDARVRDFRNPRELMVKLDISALTAGK
jgi:hypothetical protein